MDMKQPTVRYDWSSKTYHVADQTFKTLLDAAVYASRFGNPVDIFQTDIWNRLVNEPTPDSLPLIERAARFAAYAHRNQTRKYTGEPYFTHPMAVAQSVQNDNADEATIAAALLHDVLEDTETTYDELVKEFGEEVAFMVLELTDVYTHEKFPTLNRDMRKRMEAERLGHVSDRAKHIKRADMANNAASIQQNDPKFWRVYEVEQQRLLDALDGKPQW